MSQETDVRIQHDPEPLLPWPGCLQGCMGGCTPGVRANDGVHKGEIWMNSYEFARNSCEFVSYEFARNSCEFIRIHAYGSATGLPGFATFHFGRRLGVVDAFGAGLSLDDG